VCPDTGGTGGTPSDGHGYSGDATYYNDSGDTSCGTHTTGDGDYAAISFALRRELDPNCEGNPNTCSWCGRQARVTGPAGTTIVRIVDTVNSTCLCDVSSPSFQHTKRARARA
jgi:hypothetical protein